MKRLSYRIFMILMLALSFTMALHPDVRSHIRDSLEPEARDVLSSTKVFQLLDGKNAQVIKIKTPHSIIVEVYGETEPNGTTPLIDRIVLENHKEGFFTFDGEPTNLAIDDVNGDKKVDLVIPTFDKEMGSHLSVFSYSPESQKFVQISQ